MLTFTLCHERLELVDLAVLAPLVGVTNLLNLLVLLLFNLGLNSIELVLFLLDDLLFHHFEFADHVHEVIGDACGPPSVLLKDDLFFLILQLMLQVSFKVVHHFGEDFFVVCVYFFNFKLIPVDVEYFIAEESVLAFIFFYLIWCKLSERFLFIVFGVVTIFIVYSLVSRVELV